MIPAIVSDNTAVYSPVVPGLRFGACPERKAAPVNSPAEQFLQGVLLSRRAHLRGFTRSRKLIMQVRHLARELQATDELDRLRKRRSLIRVCRGSVLSIEMTIEIFAHVCVECTTLFGITLHDEQINAGLGMLRGSLVEMQTGEGKTLTAVLPAIAVAMTGTPVHVITANDYLACRDGHRLAALYNRFDLDVGVSAESVSNPQRASAYQCNVTYCSIKRLVFDYLTDTHKAAAQSEPIRDALRPILGEPVADRLTRGLCFAIIDEADSVLMDDARTPLILSEPLGNTTALRARAAVALAIARSLHEDIDFRHVVATRSIELSSIGRDAIEQQTQRLDGVWALERYRQELVCQALIALHTYRVDQDYLVQDQKVILIETNSGRPRADQKLRHGLHQMLELKEGCDPSDHSEVIATLGLQRFFQRYHCITGMSGTLREAKHELATVYQKPVLTVPTHLPCLRKHHKDCLSWDDNERFVQLQQRIREMQAAGRPILIGTRTLSLAERISKQLDIEGFYHRRLDARQDADEASVISKAGESCALTVATNMAGRGSDIPLDSAARAAGGLHVIVLELNDSTRVDRQLYGRAARQGEPGSCERMFCFDDEQMRMKTPPWLIGLTGRLRHQYPTVARKLGLTLFNRAQRRIDAQHAHQRITLFNGAENQMRRLAIAGNRGNRS